MNFDLTAEQAAFRGVVREFANEVVAPRSAEADLEEKLPLDVIKQMGDLGLFGLPFPAAVGGSDADAITVCLALEELGRVDQSVAITLSAALGLAGNLLNRFGTDEQKERWLAPLARGEALGGFGLTEPGAGSDAAEVHTTGRFEGGEWIVDGSKAFITNSGSAISTFNIVAAATEPAGGPHGISTIIVPTDTPGFEAAPVVPQARMAGQRHARAGVPRLPRPAGTPARPARARASRNAWPSWPTGGSAWPRSPSAWRRDASTRP